MKSTPWTRALVVGAVALSAAACGGGDTGGIDAPGAHGVPGATGQVPASAAASPNALLRFLQGLATTEVDEPLQLGAFEPPQADDAEPQALD
jgi:hypothetical protein